MTVCPGPDDVQGAAHQVIAAVGCNAQQLAERAYGQLTAPHALLPTALTTCLTIYVALLGFGLLTGGGLRLSEVARTGVKVGAVLALTLNWSAFQTLVFNVALGAPVELSRVFTESDAEATDDPLTRLEAMHQELIESARSLQPQAQGRTASSAQPGATPQPPAAGTLETLATTLLASTAGLVALWMVAQAVLTALGPGFVLCFLFEATRGLFTGWLRALAVAIIAPVTAWGGMMAWLATMEPWIDQLAQERAAHAITYETISQLVTFTLVFAAAQVALTIGAAVVALAVRPPRLRREAAAEPLASRETASRTVVEPPPATSRAAVLAQSLQSSRSQIAFHESRRLEVAGGARVAAAARAEAAGAPPVPRLGDAFRRVSPTARLAPSPAAHAGARP